MSRIRPLQLVIVFALIISCALAMTSTSIFAKPDGTTLPAGHIVVPASSAQAETTSSLILGPTLTQGTTVLPGDGTHTCSPMSVGDIKCWGQAVVLATGQPRARTAAASGLASESSLNKAFVGNTLPNSVTVLDVISDTILQSGVTWPTRPQVGVIAPDGTKLFLAGGGDGTVYGMDTVTYARAITIPMTGSDQRGIAVSLDGMRLYIAENSDPYQGVRVVDLQTGSVVVTVTVASHPEQIALSPDGSRLYVAANIPDENFVIDTSTNTVSGTFITGLWPRGVAVSPDGQTIYVSNFNSVSVISASNLTLLKSIPVKAGPAYLVMSPLGDRLYVMGGAGNSVAVIDVQALTATNTITFTSQPIRGTITDDGAKLYVALIDGSVGVIDTASNTVSRYIFVGGSPTTVVTQFSARSGGEGRYSIFGKVIDSANNDISSVTISAGSGYSATTDASGYYTITGLVTGTYTLTPTKTGYTFSPPSRTVSVPPNATGQDFTGTFSSVDLSVDSVAPVQVVEGQDLARNKATAVKAVIRKAGGATANNVSARLNYGLSTYTRFYVTEPANMDSATHALIADNTSYPLSFGANEITKTMTL